MKVIEAHGADALRLYLINSPVVRAESLKFKEEGVQATVREVLLPWFNAFRFFVQQVGGAGDGGGDGAPPLAYWCCSPCGGVLCFRRVR